MRTPVKWKRAPWRARAGSTRSNLPAETPPVMSRRSASAAWASAASIRLPSSPAVGSIQGWPPAAATMAASMGPLELRICPGAGSASTATISSPVVRMATRGLRKASSSAQPQAAASAICPNPMVLPEGSNSSPPRACAPWATMFSPSAMVRGGMSRTRLPSASTCSSIITASAPAGTGAPVMISHAAFGGSGPAGASPARVVPASASGACAEASAARHA